MCINNNQNINPKLRIKIGFYHSISWFSYWNELIVIRTLRGKNTKEATFSDKLFVDGKGCFFFIFYFLLFQILSILLNKYFSAGKSCNLVLSYYSKHPCFNYVMKSSNCTICPKVVCYSKVIFLENLERFTRNDFQRPMCMNDNWNINSMN